MLAASSLILLLEARELADFASAASDGFVTIDETTLEMWGEGRGSNRCHRQAQRRSLTLSGAIQSDASYVDDSAIGGVSTDGGGENEWRSSICVS